MPVDWSDPDDNGGTAMIAFVILVLYGFALGLIVMGLIWWLS